MNVLVTVPTLGVTNKGFEQKKELQLILIGLSRLDAAPSNAAELEEALVSTSAIFRGVTADNPVGISGVGIPMLEGEVDDLSFYFAIVEKDDENSQLADTIRLVLGREDVKRAITSPIDTLLPGVGGIVLSIANGLVSYLTKDKILAEHRFFGVAGNLVTAEDIKVGSDRAHATIRIMERPSV